MLKFGRNYILTVTTGDNVLGVNVGSTQAQNNQLLIIRPPLTVEFDITRKILSSANVCQIKIFNLSENNRNQIRFNIQDTQIFRRIQLQAGYGESNLPVIFSGNINQAWSERDGVNFVTVIECFDAGFAFANGFTSETFPSSTAKTDLLSSLIDSLPGVTRGAIGNYPGNLSRGNAVVGNTCDLLRTESGGGFFIDNGQAHILGNNEYIDDTPIMKVDARTGLLGTPIREQTILNFDIIFEPMIKPGRLIELQSSTDPSFNGFRKVVSVKHRGMISAAVCGNAITTVSTWFYKSYIPVRVA